MNVKFIRSVAPVLARALRSGQLFRPQCELTEPDEDIVADYEVRIPRQDGSFVTANVFRSRAHAERGEPMPVVMCAHPYDNSLLPALKKTPFGGPPQQYRLIPQEGRPRFSTITSWESPDPNFWVPAGYAVVNMNLPGYASSGGRPSIFSEDQSLAFAEAIDWVGRQDWCTGSVGLSGVSFLAISQFAVAARQSPHGVPDALKAICPWEGITSMYKDLLYDGGVEEEGFPVFWWTTEVKPTINCTAAEFREIEGGLPDEIARLHPYYDDYWKAKEPDLASIDLPMLVCASFSDQGLHTRGSFRAFMEARSKHKWLYTHRRLKWDAYYSEDVLTLTRRFFDRFVKGEDNGFEQRAPVRLEVRSRRDEIAEVRDESSWPLADTEYQPLYLHGDLLLRPEPAPVSSELAYSAKNGRLRFALTFDARTELTGYMALRLWVEARGADDMAIFVGVDKLDRHGERLPFYGCVGNHHDTAARGLIQVSRRALDPLASTPWQPVLKNESSEFLSPGEIVPVDVSILPSSTAFEAGEGLMLTLAPKEVVPSYPFVKSKRCNRGAHVVHVVHMGGEHDSQLLVPRIAR